MLKEMNFTRKTKGVFSKVLSLNQAQAFLKESEGKLANLLFLL